ncbi:MAG TPA: hypothetical protein PK222_08960 [Bacteroidales bacterium]|nr:hypothetical protein [Bacteroidales bacterium]HRT73350.1 hypothetical protein [Bacteroidales bacterium]
MKRIIIIFLSFISLLSSGCQVDSKYENYIRKLNQDPDLINLNDPDFIYHNTYIGNKYTYVYRKFNIYTLNSSYYFVFYYFTVEKGNFKKPIIVSETKDIYILADIKNNKLEYYVSCGFLDQRNLFLIPPNTIGYDIVEYYNHHQNQFIPLIAK